MNVLESMTVEGKEITVNLKVTDRKRAQDLIGTMYGRKVDEFGVAVVSWSFINLDKANERRMALIREETQRHREAMDVILAMTDVALAGDES